MTVPWVNARRRLGDSKLTYLKVESEVKLRMNSMTVPIKARANFTEVLYCPVA